MGLYAYTIFFAVCALGILLVALPASLINPDPDTGQAQAAEFYNEDPTAAWIIPVTPECVTSPSDDYTGIRTLSNTLFPSYYVQEPRGLSNLAWGFVQLVVSDIFVLQTDSDLDPINIVLGPGYQNMSVLQLETRSGINNTQNAWGCQEVPNAVTSILDASWLYGDSTRAAQLRSGSRGQMSLSAGGNLPLATSTTFLAGSDAVNENSLIAALTTIFVLEHNRIAGELYALNPGWSDDLLFYKARSYVIVEYQTIVLQEMIPALFPSLPPSLPVFTDLVSSQVTLEFALTASEFFRSMVNGAAYNWYTGNTVGNVTSTGVPSILWTAWTTHAERYDAHVASMECNNTGTNIDYISRTLAWGQQVGLATYSQIRAAYGIPTTYAAGDSATPLSGVFGEPLVRGSSLSYSTMIMFAEQLSRSMYYDPLFYTKTGIRSYIGSTIYPELTSCTLSQLLIRNAGLSAPASSAFFVRPTY